MAKKRIIIPNNFKMVLVIIGFIGILSFLIAKDSGLFLNLSGRKDLLPTPILTEAPTPTILVPTNTPIPKQVIQPTQASSNSTDTTVRQVGKYTFEGNLPCDNSMGSANDTYIALNNYRNTHGVGSLAWNAGLADVASMRTSQIAANGGVSDSHAGFIAFTNNQSNFTKLGMSELSENIAGTGSCPLLGVHIIEWLFARDAPHNNAQLDGRWTNVGISVNGSVVGVIFGK